MRPSIIKVFVAVFLLALFLMGQVQQVRADQTSCMQEIYDTLGSNGYEPGRLIVSFLNTVTLSQAAAIIQTYGFTVQNSNLFGAVHSITIGSVPEGKEVEFACRLKLEKGSEVSGVSLDEISSLFNAPNVRGQIVSTTGATTGFGGLWVIWEDHHLERYNKKYAQVQPNGTFSFPSWQNSSQQARDTQFNTYIDSDLDGVPDTRQASTAIQGYFGCESNPHTVTIVKPGSWSGSFSTTNFSFNNGQPTVELEITYNPIPVLPPSATVSLNPSSAVEPGSTTVNWTTNNIPTGSSCSNNWGALNVTNSAGSDFKSGLTVGTHKFTISCNNGTNASADFTVSPAIICTPLPSETQTHACPSGQVGSITQTRSSSCPGPAWGDWITTNNTCAPPVNSSVRLTLTTESGVFTAGTGVIVNANQNSLVRLNWVVANANSVSAISDPSQSYWSGTGPINLVGGASTGSQIVDTSIPVTIVFRLSASNSAGSTTPVGIQLNIVPFPAAYFQTTGGDVHSNKTIYISP